MNSNYRDGFINEFNEDCYLIKKRASSDDDNGDSVDSNDEKRNRGSYRCSRCNLPKKG